MASLVSIPMLRNGCVNWLMPKKPKPPQIEAIGETEVEAIGDKLCVWGRRGEWNVGLLVRIAGREIYVPVRLSAQWFENRGSEKFKLRDDAREMRDRIQCCLAAGRTVFGAAYLPNVPLPSPFMNKDWKVFPIDPAKFPVKWTPTPNAKLYPRQGRNDGPSSAVEETV